MYIYIYIIFSKMCYILLAISFDRNGFHIYIYLTMFQIYIFLFTYKSFNITVIINLFTH